MPWTARGTGAGGFNGGGAGGNKKNGRSPTGAGRMPFGRGFFGWFLFVALAIMLIMLLNKTSTSYATVPLSDFVQRLENDQPIETWQMSSNPYEADEFLAT